MKTKLYLIALLSPLIANAATYNLENIPSGSLVGQDGWTGTGPIQVSTGTGFHSSKVLISNAPGTLLINSRLNDTGFFFSTLSSTDAQVVLQFDYTANNTAELWFGVGVDRDGDGSILGSNERGFGFGHYRNSVGMTGAFSLSQLDGSLIPFPAVWGETIRLRMVVDMTGFGGEGSANLYYQNLSAGNAGFTLLFSGQKLDILDTGHRAEEFNGVFLAMSSGVQADNFTIVPEPSSGVAALGGWLFAVHVRRRRIA